MATRYRKWPIPDDWTTEDGYMTVLFCIPNSRQWRSLVTGHINQFTFGRAWNEQTGDLLQVLNLGREIFNSMSICEIEDKLERIAVALEAQQTQIGWTLPQLIQAIEELEDEDLKDQLLDWLEILNLLGVVLPDLNLSLGLSGLMEMYTTWKFRQSVVNLMEDVAISQRVQATAQFGTSGHALYSLFEESAEKLLLPAGWAGRAVWLWNRVKPTELPAWLGWATDIIGLALGSIRGATYDVAEAIETLNLTTVQTVIAQCCVGLPQLPQPVAPATVLSQDPGPSSPTSPPTDIPDEITFSELLVENGKCKAANYILDTIIAFLNNLPTQLQGQQVTLALIIAGCVASLFAIVTLLGIPVMVLAIFATTLLGLSTMTVILEQIDGLRALIEDNRSDLLCILNEAVDSQSAAQGVQQLLSNEGATPTQLTMASCLFNNVMLAHLFYESDLIDMSSGSGSCPCGEGCDEMLDSHLIFVGDLISESGGLTTATFQASSVVNAGAQQVGLGTDNGYFPDCCYKVTSWSWSGSPGEPFINGGYLCGGIEIVGTADVDTVIASEEGLNTIYLQRPIDEPFTVTISIQRV